MFRAAHHRYSARSRVVVMRIQKYAAQQRMKAAYVHRPASDHVAYGHHEYCLPEKGDTCSSGGLVHCTQDNCCLQSGWPQQASIGGTFEAGAMPLVEVSRDGPAPSLCLRPALEAAIPGLSPGDALPSKSLPGRAPGSRFPEARVFGGSAAQCARWAGQLMSSAWLPAAEQTLAAGAEGKCVLNLRTVQALRRQADAAHLVGTGGSGVAPGVPKACNAAWQQAHLSALLQLESRHHQAQLSCHRTHSHLTQGGLYPARATLQWQLCVCTRGQGWYIAEAE